MAVSIAVWASLVFSAVYTTTGADTWGKMVAGAIVWGFSLVALVLLEVGEN